MCTTTRKRRKSLEYVLQLMDKGFDFYPFTEDENEKMLKKIRNHFEVDRRKGGWNGLVPRAPIYVERGNPCHTYSIF